MGKALDDILYLGLMEGPERVAVTEHARTWTWLELRTAIERAAGGLRELGVRPQDRVQLFAPDSIWHQILMIACAEIGAIFVPINTRYTVAELHRAVRLTEPVLALADTSLAGLFDGTGADSTDEQFVIGDLKVIRFRRGDHAPRVLSRTPWVITLTSGSSGDPKPVLISVEGELDTARMFGRMWRLNAADTVLGPLPFSWVYGLCSVYLSALLAGSSAVVVPRFSPSLVYDALERHPVSAFYGTTTQFRILLDYGRTAERPLRADSLRMSITGGERRNERVLDEFSAVTGAPMFDLYAASEVRPVTGYDPVLDPWPRANRCGRIVPGVEIELRPEPLGDREANILYARSPGNYMGYFEPAVIVEPEILASDWVRVGDEFAVDADGFGQVLDRQSSLIIRGGVNISPVEIEQVLAAHPDIIDVVVVGLPDADFSERVVAGVIVRDGAQVGDEELEAHCRLTLSDYKIPTGWLRVAELPRNPNDKVDRIKFRASAIALDATTD